MKAMTDIDIASLFSEIKKCKNAIVVGHSHPDGDCVGSAVSLAFLIEALGGTADVRLRIGGALFVECRGKGSRIRARPKLLAIRDTVPLPWLHI